LFSSAHAQKVRFTDTTNKWFVTGGSDYEDPSVPDWWLEERYFYQDTVVQNGQVYQKLWASGRNNQYSSTWYYYSGVALLVREDTIAKKVYAKIYYDTTEQVLYDYNLQLGDSFFIKNNQHTVKSYVTYIDSVQLNGIMHRRWRLDHVPSYFPWEYYEVVEGVGATNGPLKPYDDNVWLFKHLDCFTNRDAGLYIKNPSWYSLCLTGLNEVHQSGYDINVFPNPASTKVNVSFKQTSQEVCTIQVYNLQQQKVLQYEKGNNQESIVLDCTQLPNGIYVLKAVQNNAVITKKFSVLH